MQSLPAAGLLWVVQPLSKRSVGLSAAVFPQEAGGMMELHTILRMDKHNINTTKETEMWRWFLFPFYWLQLSYMFFRLSNVKFVKPYPMFVCHICFDFVEIRMMFIRNLHNMSCLYVNSSFVDIRSVLKQWQLKSAKWCIYTVIN